MDYLEALRTIHKELEPENYVEIGCRLGVSLGLSKCSSIAIDPDFEIRVQLEAPTRLFKMPSDTFFLQHDVKQVLGGTIDLAFIDGMHQAEYVLRDFINVEKNSHPGTIILLDDVLPEQIEWTTRERHTQAWTGDVYQIIAILRQYRPDLQVTVLDVDMKGLAFIAGVDPTSTVLAENYASIEKAILAGGYMLASAEQIRNQIRPAPVDTLKTLLSHAKGMRNIHKAGDGRKQYLELLKSILVNEIYLDNDLRLLYLKWCLNGEQSFDHAVYHDIRHHLSNEYQQLQENRRNGQFYARKISNSTFGHSMMGRLRMDNLHHCLETLQQDNIPGDLIECGVWRGGGTIFMAGFAKVNDWNDRRIFVADSFEGLPKPSMEQDHNLDLSKEFFPELAISLETVQDNFRQYGLLNEQVIFLKGWFKDTLGDDRIQKLALLRLDGDLYASTWDTLTQLYDKVVRGGFIIVDDYGIENCRKAVEDFFSARGEPLPQITSVDWTGVYWRKG